jgi:hypothetical protein
MNICCDRFAKAIEHEIIILHTKFASRNDRNPRENEPVYIGQDKVIELSFYHAFYLTSFPDESINNCPFCGISHGHIFI